MNIKIVEKRSLSLGIFFIIYAFIIFVLFNPAVKNIAKYIFKYEQRNDFGYLDYIPDKAVVYSSLIYLIIAILLYLCISRLIKIKNE